MRARHVSERRRHKRVAGEEAARTMSMTSTFDAPKAIAAVGYLVEKTQEGLYSLMKMMYLADRLHLWRYGRMITGDDYTAMEKGPVPSHTYDLMKCVRGEPKIMDGADLASRALGYGPSHRVMNKEAPDMDELSRSDVECLDEIIRICKMHGWTAVRDLSHDDAWKSNRKKLFGFSKTGPMPLEDIAAMADEADELLRHLADPHPDPA